MHQQGIQSIRLQFKEFYSDNISKLLSELKEWLHRQTVDVYDVSFFQGEKYIVAVITFSIKT